MLLLLFIFPFPTLHLIAQGDWWVSVELADCDDPLCWRLSGGLFPHNHWRRPMLTFRNEAPAGICRRCKCVPSHSNGFTCSAPPAVCVVFVVVNSVCGWTTSGGLGEGGGMHCGLPQLSHSGLETMDILGGFDTMLQLFKQRKDTSKENHNHFISD